MSLNVSFLAHCWPKVHRYTIQECKPLSVGDFLIGYRGLPKVKVVERRAGCLRRTYLKCPLCGQLRQYLYLPPPARTLAGTEVPTGGWACRKCHGLIYASQRYGQTHLLRRILPPRTRLSRIRHSSVFPDPEWWPDISRTCDGNPFRNFKVLTDALAKYAADRQRLPWWKRSCGAHDGADRSRERRVSFGQGSA
jgi:hypothetical protein